MSLSYTRFGSKIVLVTLILLLAAGCSKLKRREKELSEDMFYFQRGMEMMEKKNYPKAVENFQVIVDSFAGSAIVDQAQFLLAEAHYKSEEYITAAFEYERVYKDYPSSKFAPQAHYQKALCYYMESPQAKLDQENTRFAIDEFNRFIDTYPTNEFVKDAHTKIDELTAKLAYKEFLSAELYRKMKHYDAAVIYYRYVIAEYPRTVWAHYSRFGIGEVHFKKKEYESAKSWYQLIINADVDAELKTNAVKRLDEIGIIESR